MRVALAALSSGQKADIDHKQKRHEAAGVALLLNRALKLLILFGVEDGG